MDTSQPAQHTVTAISQVPGDVPSVLCGTAAADGPIERRVAMLERLVHAQALTIEDQGRRLVELKIDRAEVALQPQPTSEEVDVCPWAPQGTLCLKLLTH